MNSQNRFSSLVPFELNRRSFFQTVSGLGLSFLLPQMELKAADKRGTEREKSLITIWLSGGASQLETWDPHPGTKIGGPTKAIKTRTPDLKIAEHYPLLAEQIDSFSVIRSLVSKEGDHERGAAYLKTGYRPDPTVIYPSIGAILSKENPNSNIEIPQHFSLCGGQWPARGGHLGAEHDAFKIYSPGNSIQNMVSRVGKPRQKQRLQNLDILTKNFNRSRQFTSDYTLHEKSIEQSLTMMKSKQLKAFDLKDEPEIVLAKYGDNRFGRGCLVARKLIEEGVRAVEVVLEGFDSHANNFETHKSRAKTLDPALSTLMEELKERNLLESTVVLCIGEFGRTPKINPATGRDHWPNGFSCLLGGGGFHSGLVIGETSPEENPKGPKDPVSVNDLTFTLLHALGIDTKKEFITPIGRPMTYSDGKLIEQLLKS